MNNNGPKPLAAPLVGGAGRGARAVGGRRRGGEAGQEGPREEIRTATRTTWLRESSLSNPHTYSPSLSSAGRPLLLGPSIADLARINLF
jgi:hypothetical protein